MAFLLLVRAQSRRRMADKSAQGCEPRAAPGAGTGSLADLPDDEATRQERELLAYLDRHDLSRGMPGAFLPSILLARSGNTIWVVPEESEAMRCDLRIVMDSLDAIGDALAEHFKGSDDERVQSVLVHWQNRHEAIKRDYLRYRSGMTEERLERLVAWFDKTGMHETPSEKEREPVYLAAARMARHILPTDVILELLEFLRRKAESETEKHQFPGLESSSFSSSEGSRPWEQGYALATSCVLGNPLNPMNDSIRNATFPTGE